MEVKKLEKAVKVFQQIKELDEQIIDIEKDAMLVADGKADFSIEYHVEEIKEAKEKVKFDEDGSIVRPGPSSIISGWASYGLLAACTPSKNSVSQTKKQAPDSDRFMLMFLGSVLQDLIGRRDDLIAKLKQMGF